MKTNNQSDDPDFEELMQEENEEDELAEEEDLDQLPQTPRKLTPQAAKQIKAMQKQQGQTNQQQDELPRSPQRKTVPRVANSQAQNYQKPFMAFEQEAKTGVAFSSTGEIIAKDVPMWAAKMWADLKNDINELKEAIGKM